MPRIYGYARISTDEQDIDLQTAALRKAGCEMIIEEKVSGRTVEGRPELLTLLKFISSGDTLMVTRIDRLARSVRDLQNIVHDLSKRGVTLCATEQQLDTRTAAGNAFLSMLGVFAEFENTLRAERQKAGIAKAKAAGKYKGRKRSVGRAEAVRLANLGLGVTAIARELKCSRQSVYRALTSAGVETKGNPWERSLN